jgi:NAD(P)H-hydrate epimerase
MEPSFSDTGNRLGAQQKGRPLVRALTRDEVREIDRLAIEEYGLAGIVLMENAGGNAARLLHTLAGKPGAPVAIACGRGNNGGDGFVMARHLQLLGHDVRLLLAYDPQDQRGDAAVNLHVAKRAGLPLVNLATASSAEWAMALRGSSWIVDALLGTGASGPPRGAVAHAITAINEVRGTGPAEDGSVRVFAVDLPSGLDCDTAATPGGCVRADVTATFVAPKAAFTNPAAAAVTGAVHVLDIGAPAALLVRYGLRD